MTELVFTYGTLRKDSWNHGYISDAKYIGSGKTVNSYTMTKNSIPFVSKEPNTRIVGELYEVDQYVLNRLDGLEGHPQWYRRETDPVEVNGTIHDAWLYFYPTPQGSVVESGDFLS